MQNLQATFETYKNEIITILDELKAFRLNEDEQHLVATSEKIKTIIMYDLLAQAIKNKKLLELRDKVTS